MYNGMVEMKIAIYGAGAMGTVLGAFLADAGVAVDLVSRDREHVAALKAAGARIDGEIELRAPPFDGAQGRGCALLPCEMRGEYDVVFLLTKQGGNAALGETLGGFLSPGGAVCAMQNGIPEPALQAALGEGKVLGCICAWGATKTAPGAARLTSKVGSMRFSLGAPDGGARHMLDGVKEILQKVCRTSVEGNFAGARWSKLLVNAAFSGVSAVTGYSFGEIARDRRARSLALDVARECLDVCGAARIAVEPVGGRFPADFLRFESPMKKALLSLLMPAAIRSHRATKSGMLKDLDRGVPCEIEAINGEVCRAGRKRGVPTPRNDWIVEMVHSIERGERGYGASNLGP